MNSVEFLRKYVEENPYVGFEEILNDEDFLDELKIRNELFLLK